MDYRLGIRCGFGAALVALLFNLAPGETKADKKPTLYVVGYSHLDTEWCWLYPQVIREYIPNTLHENFHLFDKYPDYVFNWTGSNRYRFMKEYYPEDYAKLKGYIAKGQWFPAGSSIEEGDVNAPSGESVLRHVLYGNEFFRHEFGVASDEFMLPDCFGFPASLPEVLAHCGLKGFSTQKLTWGSAVGIPFNVGVWKGPDGSSVIAALNPGSYTSDVRANLATEEYWDHRLLVDDAKRDIPDDYHYYGVGDRGGAPDEESVKYVMDSLHTDGPISVFAGRADEMFRDITPDQREKMPVYQGDLELTQHSAGSLTSEAEQKRWNRENELLGDAAEKASVAADWIGSVPYDKARITDAWLRFLPGQFHDLMAGTALPQAYNFAWNDQVIAMNEFADTIKTAVSGVADALDTRGAGIPLVIYNPLSIDRQDVVECQVAFPGHAPESVRVNGPDGRETLSQVVSRDGDRLKILFLANAPSIGFAVYHVHGASIGTAGDLKVSDRFLENSRYRVRLNPGGDVFSIYDKAARRELLKAPIRLAFQFENPTQYPAWNMDWNDQKAEPRGYVKGPAEVKVIERGPVRVAIQVTRKSEGSKFVQTIRLSAGEAADRIEMPTRIDWLSRECALKATFPLTVSNPNATYNWGPGTVMRGNNDPKKYEVGSHQWFDLTDKSGHYGVSVLDDSKQGSDKPDDSTLRLTLLYTPGVRGGYQHQASQDLGRHEMLYALYGHRGDWRTGEGTPNQADRMNQPLLAFQATAHEGRLGRMFSVLRIGAIAASYSGPEPRSQTAWPSDLTVDALKEAEDGHGLVVRLNERTGSQARGIALRFASPVVSAEELDGQERPIGKATVRDGQVVTDLTPYGLKTFLVHLAQPAQRMSPIAQHPLKLPYNVVATSSGPHKHDGNFDGHLETMPGDLLPTNLVSGGVDFRLGPAASGRANAVACQGQRLAITPGFDRKLFLLAASDSGDTSAAFRVGGRTETVKVQAWDGDIGQWDNRLWGGKVPELAYDWSNPLTGLQPGYIKRDPVAWYADHRRLADGSDAIYRFCYIFRYMIDVPAGARSVTLPNNPSVRLFAATLASDPVGDAKAAEPLYDVFDRAGVDGPAIDPPGGTFTDTTQVRLSYPMYWSPNSKLRYTTDGSAPGPNSTVYSEPFRLAKDTTLRVAMQISDGHMGRPTTSTFHINDVTPPSAASVVALAPLTFVQIKFSEPIDKSDAESLASYSIAGDEVRHANLEADGETVTLNLSEPLVEGKSYRLEAKGIRDLSPNRNRSKVVSEFVPGQRVFEWAKPDLGVSRIVPALPVQPSEPWTINCWVYMDHKPEDLSLVAGVGDGRDRAGAERYIIARDGHIYFWGSGIDIDSGVDFDMNRWQMVTATFDGKIVRLFKDGKLVGQGDAAFARARPQVRIAPPPAWDYGHTFKGKVESLSVWGAALPPEFVPELEKLRDR